MTPSDTSSANTMDTTGKHILFFDGDCLFCQKTAQILYRWDNTQTTYFTSLQGETASMLPPTWRNTTDTKGRASGNAVLIESCGQSDELRWRGANATLRALYLTRGPLAIFWIFYFLPDFLKNTVYDFIARNRHRLSGNKSCPLPNQCFRDRLLP